MHKLFTIILRIMVMVGRLGLV